MKFVDEHFAVIVVLTVFTMLFSSYIYMIHYHPTAGAIDWIEGEMKEVIGAILMGLTGRAAMVVNGARKSDTTDPSSSAK